MPSQRLLRLAANDDFVISIPAFAYLNGIPVGSTSSAIALETCAITAGKSIIKKGKKKMIK